jgi:glycosyltransferase involved in cell wall biosynthesis
MKVLLSAISCSPDAGSEPAVGWNWLKEVSKKNEVWVMFNSEKLKQIEKGVSKFPYKKNIHLIPIEFKLPKFIPFCLLRYYVAAELWQRAAYKKAREIIKKVNFDLIHHVTFASWWNCGHLWKLKIPFLFGPISGGQSTPKEAYGFLNFRGKISEFLRALNFEILWRIWLRPKRAIKKAAVVFVGNPETEERIAALRKNKLILKLNEVGSDFIGKYTASKTRNEINLLWSGLITHRKNFGLLLESFAKLPKDLHWNLRVAGSGDLIVYWKKKVKENGMENQIKFLGKINYNLMNKQYKWADIFVFPSLREGTPTVLLESISNGLPVICFNLCGARTLLDKDSTIKIPVKNSKQMVDDFAAAIEKLARDPELREKMSKSCINNAKKHLWSKRGEYMNKIYAQVVGKR